MIRKLLFIFLSLYFLFLPVLSYFGINSAYADPPNCPWFTEEQYPKIRFTLTDTSIKFGESIKATPNWISAEVQDKYKADGSVLTIAGFINDRSDETPDVVLDPGAPVLQPDPVNQPRFSVIRLADGEIDPNKTYNITFWLFLKAAGSTGYGPGCERSQNSVTVQIKGNLEITPTPPPDEECDQYGHEESGKIICHDPYECKDLNGDGKFFCVLKGASSNSPLSQPCPDGARYFDDTKGCKSIHTAFGWVSTQASGFTKWVLGFVLSIAGGIVVLMIIISGYRLMTSQGDPEKVKNARDQITAALVGLLFIIFSLVLLQLITSDILNLPGFGG